MKKIIFFLFTIFIFFACSNNEKLHNNKSKIFKVKTKILKYKIIPEKVLITGIVRSKKISFISPKIVGYIDKFYVKEGDQVYKDQILFTIKNKEIDEKIKSIKFKIKALYNQLSETKLLIEVYEKSLQQAKANFQLAKKNYLRFKNLIKSESVTQQEFDKIQTSFINAKLEVQKAKEFLKINKIKLQQLKNEISSLNSNLKRLNVISNYKFVKAPFKGIILKKYLDIGNLVSPGVRVLKIGSFEKVAYFNVPLKYKNFIKNYIEIDKKKYKISQIIPDVSPNTNQFKIKVNIPNSFQNGQFITGTIIIGQKKGIVIDKKFVRNFNGLYYTYICKNNYIIKTFLKGKFISKNSFIVFSGLSKSDRLITSPLRDFEENSRCE